MANKTCHVKGCTDTAAHLDWVPRFGCMICFCPYHYGLSDEETKGMTLDVKRAQADHEAGMDEMAGKVDEIIERFEGAKK